MAETLLSFGVEKLWNLLVRESERFQGFEEQFNGLKRDLSMLRCFLKDADAMKHTNERVRNIVKEINEIVFDAEDIVETFLLKDLGRTSGIGNSVGNFFCVFRERRELTFNMEVISERISKVIRDMQILGVQERYTQPLHEIQREMRQTFVTSNEQHLVGLDKNVEILVGYLVEEDSRSQVVSITGMGGLGKTTLARQVFNHKTIKSHFPALAWVCVSQQFTRKCVWETILRQLRPDLVLGETEEELQEKLVRVFETQKTLIVIDDIWREGDWDRINPVFLPKKGWKILLTSRNEEVALHADPLCVTFKPGCLTIEESWDLFQRIAFPRKDTTENKVQEEMEEMGKEMIKHCRGLPLAVKLLGGLLATRHTLSEWERVHKNITSHVVGRTSFNDKNMNNVYHILDLSYEELPIHLKHCFLYLAHFREDEEINVEQLAYYWAGDGILRPRCSDGASIRDVGDGYIEELVKRNMVISERDVRTSRFETCQLHDMVRKFCLVKAEEENFLQIVQGPSTANSESPYKSRRLVSHDSEYIRNVEREAENPKLRSLLLFGDYDWRASGLPFTRLQLMRVLDLSFYKFKREKLPSSIGKLIHLRYLSLEGVSLRRIPSSMRNLKQLLYLNLDVRGEVYMPNILKEMRELTYLHLPRRLHDKVNLELGNLVNLETLENFSTEHGCVRDLQGMTRLRTLSIYMEASGKGISIETLCPLFFSICYGARAEEDPGQSTWLSSYLGQLRYLENLTITDETGRREIVLECVHLRHLKLDIYMPRLPDDQHLPSHLIYLNLCGCYLEEDPMPILEKLGQLEKVCFSWNSFYGRRMVCSRGGFPQLQRLELTELEELEEWIIEEGSMPLLDTLEIGKCGKLEEWIVEEGSMPLLHTLTVDNCKALKELRDGLRFITSLKVLSVIMGKEWKEKLSEHHLPSRLTSLKLFWCRLEEDPMPILEKLGQLEELCLGWDSFCGRRMVCSRGGFLQLQKLELYELEELEEWIIEEGSMPLLHTLQIDNCGKLEEWIVKEGSMPLLHTLTIANCKALKELRDGLRFITSLKVLSVNIMGKGWEDKLSEQHLPSRLTWLYLKECRLEEDPMPILEKLDQLKGVCFYRNSFCGKRMVCSRGGFPQLQELRLYGLEVLEEWIIEEGSMPLLHTLIIDKCKALKELPDGLRFITSLALLKIFYMGDGWKKRLSEGGEDYYKVQHIPDVSFGID